MIEKDKNIKIGIFGCGNIVKTIHLPVLLNIKGVEIAFLFDIDAKKSKGLANDFNLSCVTNEESIKWDEIDCFLIATPYGAREELFKKIKSLANENSRILIEKPAVLSEVDIQAFKDLGLYEGGFSGFMRRYYSNTNILKNICNDDKIFQKIKRINLSEGFKTTATTFGSSSYHVSKMLSGGGILAETSCHLFDQIDYIFPDSKFDVVRSMITYDNDIDVHVEAEMRIEKNNHIIPLAAKFSRLERLPNQISIDLGEITLTSGLAPADKVSIEANNPSGFVYALDYDFAFAINSYQAFYMEWVSIIEDIVSKKSSTNRLSKTFQSGLIIESLYKCSKKNGTFARI